VAFETIAVADAKLEILQLTDMPGYLEKLAAQAGDATLTLPFWAKVWPSAIILGYLLGKMEPGPDPILEIGAGVGLAGLAAAARGHRVILSDIESDALLFARANVLRNNLQDLAEVRRTDFARDDPGGPYRCIVAADVLYMREHFAPLIDFLERGLAPGGEAILAKSRVTKAAAFLSMAEDRFHIQEKTVGYKSVDNEPGGAERHLVTVYRLRPKTP
jgi:predicted nicotinamide N-methyase